MEIGASGASGARVQGRVNKENNQEPVNVIHQLHSTVVRNVMESQRKLKNVTKRSPVLVSLICKLGCTI